MNLRSFYFLQYSFLFLLYTGYICGQTTASVNITTLPLTFKPALLKASDMNNDGKTDLIVMSTASDTVFAIYHGLGDGSFNSPYLYRKEVSFCPFDAADLNGDKIRDIVISSYFANSFSVYWGNDNHKFIPGPTYHTDAHATDVAITDIDKDGFQDVIGITSGSASPVTLNVFKGDEKGNLHKAGKYSSLLAYNIDIYPVDKNGDGLQDVLVSTFDGLALYYQQNDGSFLLRYWPTYKASLVIGDINRDMNPDMILGYTSVDGDKQTDSIVIRYGEADTMFNLNPLKIIVPGLHPGPMFLADLDKDTYPELLVHHYSNDGVSTDSLYIFRGAGNNGFSSYKIIQAPDTIKYLITADLTNDSYPEIITVSSEKIMIIHNQGNILSANDQVKQRQIPIYPNPVTNSLFMELPDENYEIHATDIHGRKRYISRHTGLSKIDVSSWPSGAYFFQVYQKNALQFSKIIIKQ